MTTRREAIGVGLGTLAGLLTADKLAALETLLGSIERSPQLDVALKAARWIAASRIETPDGIAWPADPAKPESIGADLYNGMPGIVLFHLDLFRATGDTHWLDEARLGANELIAKLPKIAATGDAGLYTGLAGIAWVLEEVHRASSDGRYRDHAMRALTMIHSKAEKTGNGVAWTGNSATNDVISGSAGIGLFLLWADAEMMRGANRDLAQATGERLLELGQPANGGLKWAVAPSVKNLYPNFSHGTAGVSYFLAFLYQISAHRAFLDGALAGARYLTAVANTDGEGLKVFHHEPGGESLFYLSWCHGPAGTSRLFYKLAQVTQDDRWLEMIRRGARATIDSGIPEQRTPGFWNNISQCCGNCGVGEYFLWLQRVMPNGEYAGMVRRAAEDTMRRSTAERDGLKWVQAENRVSPDDLVAQTGYMQGASGVGAFFLHMDALTQKKPRAIVWPDAPSP